VNRGRINWGKLAARLVIVGYLAFVVLPLIWLLLMSLKGPLDVMALPPKIIFKPTLENYRRLFLGTQRSQYEVARTDFPRALLNTVIVAGGATVLSLVTGVLAAYAFARFHFAGKESLAFTILSLRFAPALATLIPTYALYRRIGLYNTHIGLILISQVISMPLLIWVVRSYIESIPIECEQAALVDGYSWWGAFRIVVLPLASPGIAATSVLAFVFCWNNFIFGLFLAARQTQTLVVATLAFISYEQVLWGQMAAASVMTVIPAMAFIFMVQRWLVRGLTFGAVKA